MISINFNERYVTPDGCIAKYVHEDGSETAIKTWPKGMETCGIGRNKFNVFASCSVGCQIKCSFCYLTAKNYAYEKISSWKLATNITSAIEHEFIERPELREIPMNLSWMGMGDPWLNLSQVVNVTEMIITRMKDQVVAFEGIDIATSLPIIKYDDIDQLRKLNDMLCDTGKLTYKPETRSNVRVFYSLHSMNQIIRNRMIPKSVKLNCALPHLSTIGEEFNVILHQILLEGVNDEWCDFHPIYEYLANEPKMQLRLLRFNPCPNTKFKETEKFDELVKMMQYYLPGNRLKVQISPGSEISAACGMFLMKNLK